jgi:hypothetical protein
VIKIYELLRSGTATCFCLLVGVTRSVAQFLAIIGRKCMKRIDEQLGELTYDPDIGWWEGRVTLTAGSSFVLYVHTPGRDDSSITEGVKIAFEKMRISEQVAREFAASKLLSVHNDTWNEGEKIDASEFVRRLVPATIQIWPNGNAEISFGDDNLFWGHEVGVRYRGGRFTEAVVQG